MAKRVILSSDYDSLSDSTAAKAAHDVVVLAAAPVINAVACLGSNWIGIAD